MSMARVTVTNARKTWTCGKCGATISPGEKRVSFKVGFRGRSQTRCDLISCYPTRGERESSLISEVFDAIDGISWAGISSGQEIREAVESVSEAIGNVLSQYEESPMFDRSDDLQERHDILTSAQTEVDQWEPQEEEPTGEDGEPDRNSPAYETWLDETIEDARGMLDELELP